MVKEPRPPKRPPKPDPTASEDTVELLRALARRRGARSEHPGDAPEAPHEDGAETFESLRAIAAQLDFQLRSQPDGDASNAASHPVAAARPPSARKGALAREWRTFVAALPPLGVLIPRLRRERLAFVLISVAVLAVAGVGRMLGIPNPGAGHGIAFPRQIVPPTASGPGEAVSPPDIPAINRAMAECDAAAARNTDSLVFLVLPVVRAGGDSRDWRPSALQSVGASYLLLNSKDALDGLRDGSLAVRPGRYTFSVLDPATGATYSWTSATGMSRLERPDSGALKGIQLGFDFSAAQTGPHWSKLFERKPGSCYWVAVLALG